MQYWTKNGSIPTTLPDSTAGWQHAPEPPTDIPEGKELVWLNWEWVVRDPKPQDRAGYQWNWQHDTRSWVECAWPNVDDAPVPMPSDGKMDQWDEATTSWVEA